MPQHNDTHIMVVEDSDDDFEATERGLRKDGYLFNPLIRCETGEDALDYLLRQGVHSGKQEVVRPSVILLDLNLPGKGGAAFLAALKSEPEISNIPVIVLTTSSDPNDIERCYKMGANSYIQKPVSLERFLATIRQLREYWIDLASLPGGRS